MDALLGEALKASSNPLVLIILLLIAKDFYERKSVREAMAKDATIIAGLKALRDSLDQIYNRVEKIADDMSAWAGRQGRR